VVFRKQCLGVGCPAVKIPWSKMHPWVWRSGGLKDSSLSSGEDDYMESIHQTDTVSCFSKGRAPAAAGTVLELTQ